MLLVIKICDELLNTSNIKKILWANGFKLNTLINIFSSFIIFYFISYNKNSEIVINAMDPRLNLNLNKNKFIFSDRDLLAPNFDKIIF